MSAENGNGHHPLNLGAWRNKDNLYRLVGTRQVVRHTTEDGREAVTTVLSLQNRPKPDLQGPGTTTNYLEVEVETNPINS